MTPHVQSAHAMTSLRRNIAVSALFTVFRGPAIAMILVPWLVTRFRLPTHVAVWQRKAGGMLIAAGLALLLEFVVRFVVVGRGSLVPILPTQRLVVNGLYRHVRNPMYLGVLTTSAGEDLLFRSLPMVVYLAVLWACFDAFVCFYEER